MFVNIYEIIHNLKTEKRRKKNLAPHRPFGKMWTQLKGSGKILLF